MFLLKEYIYIKINLDKIHQDKCGNLIKISENEKRLVKMYFGERLPSSLPESTALAL